MELISPIERETNPLSEALAEQRPPSALAKPARHAILTDAVGALSLLVYPASAD